MKILITGATGLIGRAIIPELLEKGHELFLVGRNKKKMLDLFAPLNEVKANSTSTAPQESASLSKKIHFIEADLNKGPLNFSSGSSLSSDSTSSSSSNLILNSNSNLPSELKKIEAIVHLSGENIGDQAWSLKQKEKIRSSRALGTQHLLESFEPFLASNEAKLKVLLSASAIGYYGHRGDEILTESSEAGSGFLAEVCQAWEKPLLNLLNSNLRTVILRLGLVLSSEGGILEKIKIPFRYGLCTPLGQGNQWMSWIHINDLKAIILKGLEENEFSGIYNAVAPEFVRNREFTKIMAKHFQRLLLPGVPSFLLSLILGERSELLLNSQRVLPKKLQAKNYQFLYPNLEKALIDLLPRNKCKGDIGQ